MGGTAWALRDLRKRVSAEQFEVQRRAFLYVARNTTLPAQIRHKAQLGLNALNGGEGRMTAVKNRCTETGRGRGEWGGASVERRRGWGGGPAGARQGATDRRAGGSGRAAGGHAAVREEQCGSGADTAELGSGRWRALLPVGIGAGRPDGHLILSGLR